MFANRYPAVRSQLLAALASLALLVFAGTAQALSIGEVTLHSRLGEPLRATVPLGSIGSLSEDQIIVGRAAEDVYRAYGMDRASFNSPIGFKLNVDAKGVASVDVSTEQPLSEPFVDMILEVRWPSGRAVKQFTLLLDLPAP